MKVFAAILAAGQGSRFGSDKTQIVLRGKPLWRWAFDTYNSHPSVDAVGLVGSEGNLEALRQVDAAYCLAGGSTRQQSSRIAVSNVPTDYDLVLIHDAARPLVSHTLISDVIRAATDSGAAAPALPVSDTIRKTRADGFELVDRSGLQAMQTPQAGRRDLLLTAHEQAKQEFTDDIALLESIGINPSLIPGEKRNLKVTDADDLHLLAGYLGPPETRTGMGYDIHPFGDKSKPCMLGGVAFDDAPGLEGHSDADVLLHAIVDALLGAAAMGDIGTHFPNTDPQWKDSPSTVFLLHAGGLINSAGWRILNLDATVIAEFPKVMKKAEAIRLEISRTLGIDSSRISIKATTNERLGAIGRGEGIAAFATATIIQAY